MGRSTREPDSWLADDDDDGDETGATVVMSGSVPAEFEGLFEDDEPSEDASPTVMMDSSSVSKLEEGLFPAFSLAPEFGIRPDEEEGVTEVRPEDQDRTVVLTDPTLPPHPAPRAPTAHASGASGFGMVAVVLVALVAALGGALVALLAVGLVWWW